MTMTDSTLDVTGMKNSRTVQHSAGLFCGVFEPTSHRFVAGAIDGRLVAWSYPDFANPTAFDWHHHGYVSALAALPQQRRMVSAGYDRRLVWWDPTAGVPLHEVSTGGRPMCVAVSPDEHLVAVVDDDRWLRIFDAQTGQLQAAYDDHPAMTLKMLPSSVYCVAFSPNGRFVATGDRTGQVLLREVASGKNVHTLSATRFYSDFRKGPDGKPSDGEYELGGVRLLVFSPDSQILIAGGMADYDPNSAATDGNMGLVGFATGDGQELFATVLSGNKGYLQAAVFHPSGRLIAAGGGGTAGNTGVGSICILDPSDPQAPVTESLEMTVRALSLTPNADQLLICGMLKTAEAGQIEVWDLSGQT